MPKTTFIINVDHDDGFTPPMFHEFISEMLEDAGQGDDARTRTMNSVEVVTAVECGECSQPFDPGTMVQVVILDGHEDQPMEISDVCDCCFNEKCWAPGYGYSNGYGDVDDYDMDETGALHLKEKTDE